MKTILDALQTGIVAIIVIIVGLFLLYLISRVVTIAIAKSWHQSKPKPTTNEINGGLKNGESKP